MASSDAYTTPGLGIVSVIITGEEVAGFTGKTEALDTPAINKEAATAVIVLLRLLEENQYIFISLWFEVSKSVCTGLDLGSHTLSKLDGFLEENWSLKAERVNNRGNDH
ncbi:MAG: hypothetical protein U0X40_03945 [Ferruginibacter sp.]